MHIFANQVKTYIQDSYNIRLFRFRILNSETNVEGKRNSYQAVPMRSSYQLEDIDHGDVPQTPVDVPTNFRSSTAFPLNPPVSMWVCVHFFGKGFYKTPQIHCFESAKVLMYEKLFSNHASCGNLGHILFLATKFLLWHVCLSQSPDWLRFSPGWKISKSTFSSRHALELNLLYASALQPVCTVHPRVHQNMHGVHHYKKADKGASQTCHTKQILFTKTFC